MAGSPRLYFGGHLKEVHRDEQYRMHCISDEFRQRARNGLDLAWAQLAERYLSQSHMDCAEGVPADEDLEPPGD